MEALELKESSYIKVLRGLLVALGLLLLDSSAVVLVAFILRLMLAAGTTVPSRRD